MHEVGKRAAELAGVGTVLEALAAHHSEVNGPGRLAPVMRLLVRLPPAVFGLILGREWFVDAATTPVTEPATGIFSSH
ncbi:hypothetical protein FHR32_007376 [Streptosporangium album]|uniref:Uncharacterized protein n=1 Tax=Streptosporangium album TaxID=47479 RepID=A0A7W7WDC2_9ACTN|nr:hypothetical protein [Streptosporangium album]MBB4942976.1 hypothetical protein [Streptosporangium album]